MRRPVTLNNLEQAVKLITHFGKGLQQTPSGHWAYNGHVLYNFIALRGIKGLDMRGEAERFASQYSEELTNRLVDMETAIYKKEVAECIKPGIHLEHYQVAALISFAHSIGISNFAHCATVKCINEGKSFEVAADFMLQWVKVNTLGLSHKLLLNNKETLKLSPELIGRRKAEKNLFLTGILSLPS